MNNKPLFVAANGPWTRGDNHEILDRFKRPVAVVPPHPERESAERLIAIAPELMGEMYRVLGMLLGAADVLADSLPETSDYFRARVADLLDLTERAMGVKP